MMNFRMAPMLAVLFLFPLAVAAAPQSGKVPFEWGEALLKQGKTPQAYDAFTMASAIEPSNKKFQKKKAEVGAILSIRLL